MSHKLRIDSKEYKKDILDKLFNPKCKLCPLHQSSTNVCIRGRGPLNAPIMLIGEAPGAAESKQGKPFMGRAGKLLDKILKELGIEKNVYITNAVHCRPPENRKPKDAEINKCRMYLFYEIAVIKPKVVVLMGKTATQGTVGKPNLIKFKVGYKEMRDDTWILTTWHPAYCLRRGKGAINDLTKSLREAKNYAGL